MHLHTHSWAGHGARALLAACLGSIIILVSLGISGRRPGRAEAAPVRIEGWVVDDLRRGVRVAKNVRKPLLVVLRCVP